MNKFIPLSFIVFLVIGSFLAVLTPASASDLVEDSWNTKTPMRQPRLSLGVVAVNGQIYAIGGYGENGWVGTNERYDPVTDEWVTRRPMPTARADFAIAAYRGKIYCIGGTTPGAVCSVNEVYDTGTGRWGTKAPLPVKAGNLQAHVVDGKIFVINAGGFLYMYDPVTDVWSEKSNMTDIVLNAVSAVMGNKIIVIGAPSGACQELSGLKVLIYDPKADAWSEGKTGPENVYINAVGVTSGVYAPCRVYCFGQSYNSTELTINAVYNPEKNTWSTAEPMSTSRRQFSVAVVDDVLYVIGGNNNGYGFSSVNEQYVPLSGNNLYYLIIPFTLIIGTTAVGLFFYFRKRKKAMPLSIKFTNAFKRLSLWV